MLCKQGTAAKLLSRSPLEYQHQQIGTSCQNYLGPVSIVCGRLPSRNKCVNSTILQSSDPVYIPNNSMDIDFKFWIYFKFARKFYFIWCAVYPNPISNQCFLFFSRWKQMQKAVVIYYSVLGPKLIQKITSWSVPLKLYFLLARRLGGLHRKIILIARNGSHYAFNIKYPIIQRLEWIWNSGCN